MKVKLDCGCETDVEDNFLKAPIKQVWCIIHQQLAKIIEIIKELKPLDIT